MEAIMAKRLATARALDAGLGIVRLAPTWVPRSFCTPGQRIRLHPDDYFALGPRRGGINERWLASAVRADNGGLTGPDEGLSMVVDPEGLVPFDEFVADHGPALLGERLWQQYGRWPMYSKFFDNQRALPLHVHHRDHHAALVDKPGKPEAYYYPPQMNATLGEQPISFLGLQPDSSKDRLLGRLKGFGLGGDNRITELSLGYRTQLGTGWDIPAGVLHAPASVCTYEPQADCDVFSMFESWSNEREVPEELLWKDIPGPQRGDYEFLVELLDWEANVDPNFIAHRFMTPSPTAQSRADGEEDYTEKWIVYRSPRFSAKELSVYPGRSVTIGETDAYGAIVIQGRGTLGSFDVSAPTLIHYGELTQDELFVSAPAASAGARVTNNDPTEPLVILKHFGPGNEQLAADRPAGYTTPLRPGLLLKQT
jgi:hypothetical protein